MRVWRVRFVLLWCASIVVAFKSKKVPSGTATDVIVSMGSITVSMALLYLSFVQHSLILFVDIKFNSASTYYDNVTAENVDA